MQFNLSCVNLQALLPPFRTLYPNLIYLGIWYSGDYGYVYAQNTERMSGARLTKVLRDVIDTTGIASYATKEGELQEEWRSKPVRGTNRAATRADISAVHVHPLGKESLQHITAEYLVNLLKEAPQMDMFYKFGLKLYSLEQNINFRARKKYKDVRVRYEDGWITVSKGEAYEEILPILVGKIREAVCKFKDDIPSFCVNHFDAYAESILDCRDSTDPKLRKKYETRRNKCLDNIAVSANENLKRLGGWMGKNPRLV